MAGLDDTEQEQESVGNHLGKLRERMGAARAVEEDTDEVSTEAPEVEDDDDEPEAEVAPTRRERRAGRQTARERAAAAEAEAKVLRELIQQRPAERPTQQVPDTADVDRRIRATYAELERLENDYIAAQTNKTLTPAMEREMREKAQELEIRKLELAAERREVREAPNRRQRDLADSLARDNADVYQNPRALQYAAGRVNQLIAMGEKDSKELHDKVMAETRQVVLGIKPKPDAIDRQRATGMSAGPRALPTTTRSTISMPKGSHYYRMATALYPDLEPAQACQKWAQGPGKRLLQSKG